MADYFPLISRAVAGLRSSTPEARQSIYDRARQALVAQLRAMDPPIPEEAIERETNALADAVARVEADLAAAPTAPDPRPPAPAAPPPLQPKAPAAVRAEPRPTMPPPLRPPVSKPVTPPEPTTAKPADPKPADGAKLAEEAPALRVPAAPDVSASPGKPALPTAPVLQVGETAARGDGAPPLSAGQDGRTGRAEPGAALREPGDRGRDDLARPAAPRPIETSRPNYRVWIVAVVALAAVIAIAVTAWRLRDDPQDLARVPAPTVTAEQTPGKIIERADAPAPQGGSETPAAQTAPASPASPATQPDPAAAPAAGQPAASPDPQTLPVAQKAAILVDAPDEPQKVKTYVGTVVWRSETVTDNGQDQPISEAIRADVDIPEAKTQLKLQIRRNTEPQFPASHTVDVRFTIAADSPLGNVKQINVPQMRRQDMPTGDPLAGVPVTITDNNFLVGLARGSAEQQNLDLLSSRGWMDIPMLLANGKPAKITFEKGAVGDQVFAKVIQGWK